MADQPLKDVILMQLIIFSSKGLLGLSLSLLACVHYGASCYWEHTTTSRERTIFGNFIGLAGIGQNSKLLECLLFSQRINVVLVLAIVSSLGCEKRGRGTQISLDLPPPLSSVLSMARMDQL